MKQTEVKRSNIEIPERFRKDAGDIQSLADSINESGLISPIAVLDIGGGKYKLLAGGRRMLATERLGWKTIPVRVYTEDEEVDEIKALMIELEENVKRKDLTPQEQVENIQAIHDAMIAKYGEKKDYRSNPDAEGWSIRETAKRLNRKDVGHVAKEITLGRAMKVMPDVFSGAKTMSDMKKAFDRTKVKFERATEADDIRRKVANTPEDIRRKNLIDSFIVGAVQDHLKMIPDASVDFIELDPPYAIDLKKQKKMKSNVTREEQVQRYNEIDVSTYPDFLNFMFKEFYRVLKKDRWLVVWFGQHPWYNQIKIWLESAGFDVRPIAGIWTKGTGQVNNPKMDMANTYETFFYARKGQAFLNKEGRNNEFDYRPVSPTKKAYEGLPERPIEMMTDLLYTFVREGSNILVPCCGSGNTMLAADNIACKAVGIDLSQENKDVYTVRVNEQKPGGYSSYE